MFSTACYMCHVSLTVTAFSPSQTHPKLEFFIRFETDPLSLPWKYWIVWDFPWDMAYIPCRIHYLIGVITIPIDMTNSNDYCMGYDYSMPCGFLTFTLTPPGWGKLFTPTEPWLGLKGLFVALFGAVKQQTYIAGVPPRSSLSVGLQ